ncbi:capsular polysaccharide biosynthesis protein CapK [Cellvibrio zantedeschiae]|uniref:Capsular polysaccharide biosynthesis protein CapK n=1 Tax=Cellvibrio zantedeschiae TaxID=1237077 RepID=A0ABQ3BBA2_9GAMM|nr:phenylacetate--CoA ligase family protein [Cellvibrio zantedeschiae]GGY82246.1 capsular polysaccharide biosynthesis protein CapK [Cellvibrio zantedeschiae]
MSHEIYLSLPALCQNIALSAYGMNLYNQRFKGPIPIPYNQLGSPFAKPTKSDIAQQTQRLHKLLTHCQKYVPYYEPFLKSIDITNITAENLDAYLPKLTKKMILNCPDEFISRAPEYDKKKLLKLNTSGSSGTPLTLFASHEARRINYKYYEQALNEFGCTYHSKSTTFAGRILYKNPGNSPARFDFFNNTQYLSSYFISPATIHSYIDALNKWQPNFIDAYPSALTELCSLAIQNNAKVTFKPKVVLTSSESLSPYARNIIESFFDAPVLDHYGCTEMAISAFSHKGKYFVPATYAAVEMEHAFDNVYSIITTGLLNFAMPLLRYEIGDLAIKSFPDCNYVFDSIEGRTDDVIVTPEGNRIGRMDPAFKGIEGVEQAQIIQKTIDTLNVLIKLNVDNSSFNEALLIANIKTRTSSNMKVHIFYVEKIEKTKNGKLKSVISEL